MFVKEKKMIHSNKNFGEKEIVTRKKIAEEEIVIVEEVDQPQEKEIMKGRGQEKITREIGEAMKGIIVPMIVGGMIVAMIVDGMLGKIVEIIDDEEVDPEHLQDQVKLIILMIILEFDWKERMMVIRAMVLASLVVVRI